MASWIVFVVTRQCYWWHRWVWSLPIRIRRARRIRRAVILLHARTVIETWRREYNEERPKNVLGGLTPEAYALKLAKME